MKWEPDQYQRFLNQYGALLRDAYPERDAKTVFPFSRTFVLATGGRQPAPGESPRVLFNRDLITI